MANQEELPEDQFEAGPVKNDLSSAGNAHQGSLDRSLEKAENAGAAVVAAAAIQSSEPLGQRNQADVAKEIDAIGFSTDVNLMEFSEVKTHAPAVAMQAHQGFACERKLGKDDRVITPQLSDRELRLRRHFEQLITIVSPTIALVFDIVAVILMIVSQTFTPDLLIAYRIVFDVQLLMGIYAAVQVSHRRDSLLEYHVRFCMGNSVAAAVGFQVLLVLYIGLYYGIYLLLSLVGVIVLMLLAFVLMVLPSRKRKYRLLDFLSVITLLSVLMLVASQELVAEIAIPLTMSGCFMFWIVAHSFTQLYYFFMLLNSQQSAIPNTPATLFQKMGPLLWLLGTLCSLVVTGLVVNLSA